jgi:hypothetical protein
LNGGRVISIFPEGTLPVLAFVEFLSGATSDKPHCRLNFSVPLISYQQMNVIGRCYVVEYGQTIATLRLEQPVAPPFSIYGELEQERFLVAPVRDVPDIARAGYTVGSRHADLLIQLFGCQKGTLAPRHTTIPCANSVKSASSVGPTPQPQSQPTNFRLSSMCSCSSFEWLPCIRRIIGSQSDNFSPG